MDISKPIAVIGANSWGSAAYGKLLRGSSSHYRLGVYSYYLEHPAFEIYVGEEAYLYEVYAAFQTAIDGPVYAFDLDDDDVFMEYMEQIRELSFYDMKEIAVTPRSKVLVLSTCIDYPRDYDYRYVAVLVRREKLLQPVYVNDD